MNKQRTNPAFDRLSDLVYLSSLEKLEAAIRDEEHTDSELSEALSEIIAELKAASGCSYAFNTRIRL